MTGLTYPHDWGFVPSTKADDGDPIDIMVVHDAATFPGIVLTCRVIGILQIEQKSKGKTERNDRLFAVPGESHSEQALKDVRDLSEPIQQELEKFFKATDYDSLKHRFDLIPRSKTAKSTAPQSTTTTRAPVPRTTTTSTTVARRTVDTRFVPVDPKTGAALVGCPRK